VLLLITSSQSVYTLAT